MAGNTREGNGVISDGAGREDGAMGEVLAGVALENLPARVAIIDELGIIVAVNRAWHEFAATDGVAASATEGVNYLKSFEAASGDGAQEAARFAEGIRSVLSGERQEFTVEYPCHSSGERRWFIGSVVCLHVGDARWAVITHEDITGRKLDEERLLRSEARNKAMLEAVPDLMFLISREGEYLDFRARDEGKLYVPPEEFVGRNLREIMPQELAGSMLENISRALDTGETQLIEYSLPMPEGVRDFEARLVASGPAEILSVVRDVTGRKLAEKKLRASEERFRLLAENARDVIFRYRLGPTPKYDYVSPSVEMLTGYTPEEFYADPMLAIRLVLPEYRPLVENLMESPESPLLLHLRHRDGRLIWIEQRNKPVRDESGNLVGIEGIARDVTRRKLAESEREQLLARERAAHQHLEVILDNLGEGVLVIGSGELVLFANTSARAMLGMTDDSTPAEFPDPFEGFSLRDAVDRCARTGEVIEARARCGGRFLQIRLDRLSGSKANEVLVVLQDLSEGHRLEANQQRFLSNAAHQLRTPLTAILGAAELLASGGDEDPTLRERLLKHISSESRRMKRLSDVLLRLAHVGWGEREPAIESLNLRGAARYAAELVEPLAESAGLGIVVEAEDAYVRADSEWLQEILLVLLSNSIQHSGRGGFIRLIARGATIIVEDEGVGISQEDLPHVFERLYRGRGSSEGFGIGLSICKELTERMGGSISIRSQEGVGTAIMVALPGVGEGVTNSPG
ncbi:MAG TPA: PAS domain S-box protein [Rubrobacter sp.]|nr:PAS domain S-box protein [Rubrobacter sp.]